MRSWLAMALVSSPMVRTRFGKISSSSCAMKPNFRYFASAPRFRWKETGRSSRKSHLTCSPSLGLGPKPALAPPSKRSLALLAMVSYSGWMLRFRRRSDVVILASDAQAPCSVPPEAVTVMPLYVPAYSSICDEVIVTYVASEPSEIRDVLNVPTDKVLPRFTKSRTDKAEPKRTLEKMDSLEPNRKFPRTDIELPKVEKSNKDMEEAMRQAPSTEREDPMRAMDRNESAEPRWKKSRTDRDDPKRDTPQTDKADPTRANDLTDTLEPTCANAKTESEDPILANPNTDIADPMRAKLRRDKDEPTCPMS
mmetsp:Transcript_14199/g.33866  ORF Transcript_14199/g.33866 Transcript_14199/m.33866 type:complete len:309 (-) Transcript_14199:3385-4311(-)